MLKLIKRNKIYYVCGYAHLLDGRSIRIRQSTKTSDKFRAEHKLRGILSDLMIGEYDHPKNETVSDAINHYLRRPTQARSNTDKTNLCGSFEQAFGKERISVLDQKEVNEYFTDRGTRIQPNSLARQITSFNAMINYCESSGWKVPSWRMKKPTYSDERVRWLTEAERDDFLLFSHPAITDVLTFLFYTGARKGEAFDLRKQDILHGQAHLTTYKKRGKKHVRAVPLTDNLVSLLNTLTMKVSGNALVFKDEKGRAWTDKSFPPYFKESLALASISDFKPHDCRHTFASLLVQKGASLKAVADLLGHSSLDMVMRYAHLAPSHLAETISLIDSDKASK